MMAERKLTKSMKAAADVTALLRARNPLLWVVTREEARVETYLMEAAAAASYPVVTWDVAAGVVDPLKKRGYGGPENTDPSAVLAAIETRAETKIKEGEAPTRRVWFLRDLPEWLKPPIGMITLRALRNLAKLLPGIPANTSQAMIIIAPTGDVPAELADHATVIEWPLPDREEIAQILEYAIEDLPDAKRKGALPKAMRDAAIDAAVGLSGEEAQACYARSLVQTGRIDPALVAREKKGIIAKAGVLEWYDPLPGGLDAVGGLGNLKDWLVVRGSAWSAEARRYGLPAPRGAFLVGISGCGKTLTAKACATAWDVPLIKMDLGALKSKFVGESEANIRKAFRVVEAIGRCVLWFDEIEKALGGATQGAADGGVSSDALGTILTWMQERQGEAFVLATANDIEALPPELTRAGRFDAIFFVDTPTEKERVEVLRAALTAFGKQDVGIKLERVAAACGQFTGAEIAALVPEAMFKAFADGKREITTEDLTAGARDVVPLVTSSAEKIRKLREWGASRARPASRGDEDFRPAPRPRRERIVDL
jgi:AAA+ superfamily predicted ATPase